jgi:hypothetical protein
LKNFRNANAAADWAKTSTLPSAITPRKRSKGCYSDRTHLSVLPVLKAPLCAMTIVSGAVALLAIAEFLKLTTHYGVQLPR